MSTNRTDLEVEIKLKVPGDLSAIKRKLSKLGFRVLKKRVFEDNFILDTRGLKLRKSRELIRIRRVDKSNILTYKGPPVAGPHKSREEIETEFADAGRMRSILTKLGYLPMFRYQKYRTEYGKPRGQGVVTVDETPIGNFLELEGPPGWIDRTAKALDFAPEEYITASYGRLYLEFCKTHRTKLKDMIF